MLRNFMDAFDDDPFFSMHNERLRGADEIFSSFFNSDPHLALTDDAAAQRHGMRGRRGAERSNDQDFDGSMDLMMLRNPFESMTAMMRNMHNMITSLPQQMKDVPNDPDAHVYSQSSVMSYSNVGNGQPKVYQATTMSRQLPGGLRETRKAVRDSEARLEKMAIGRHINERGNVITRQRNMQSGDMGENKEYYNMVEDDLPQFDSEWQEKTKRFYQLQTNHNALGAQHQSGSYRAVDANNNANRTKHYSTTPALEAAPRESRHKSRSSRYK